jgi:hypothetical protein
MYLSRTGPGTALVLSGTALVLLAVAPFGWRLGWNLSDTRRYVHAVSVRARVRRAGTNTKSTPAGFLHDLPPVVNMFPVERALSRPKEYVQCYARP